MTGYDFTQYLLETFGAMILAAILIAFFGYKILEKYVHSKFDERLGDLEREFQRSLSRMNRYHSISQATLEKAFEKKIKVYELLLDSVNERHRFINENPLHDEPDSDEEHLGYFLKIIEIIESSILYVTSDLAAKYDSWYQSARPYIKASNDSEYEQWQHSFGTDNDSEYAYYAGLPDKLMMMRETKAEFHDLLACIDQDIRDIRASLERPMDTQSRRSDY